MRRLVASVAIVLAALMGAARADAQVSGLSVDDMTPVVGQTVTVSVSCVDTPELLQVFVVIFTDPFVPNASTPTSFFEDTNPASFTFPLTFNVAGDFTIRATCDYETGTQPSRDLDLTVTVPDTIPPTTTTTTSTTAGPAPTAAETTTSTSIAGTTTTSASTSTSTSSPTTTPPAPSSEAPATSVSPEVLPATGQGVGPEAAVTAVAIVAGTGLLILARRRDRKT